MASVWGLTPRQSIELECRRVGVAAFVDNCVAILRSGDIDEATLYALAGPGAAQILRGVQGGVTGYWPRVWATRGLLYAWSDVATSDVIRGTRDESWRVREMSAKVVARHHVDDALEAMVELRADSVLRVRQAAERALVRLAASGT